MRRDLIPSFAQVESDGCLGVDGVSLVRVDSHTEQAGVGLKVKLKWPDFIKYNKSHIDQFCLVSGPQVVEDRGLIEIGEVGHVLAFLKLRRIHLQRETLHSSE